MGGFVPLGGGGWGGLGVRKGGSEGVGRGVRVVCVSVINKKSFQ